MAGSEKSAIGRPALALSASYRSIHCGLYCPAHRLIVEVDGEIHEQQQDYDCARTEHLQGYGYTVIRFSNQAVESDLKDILATIYRQTLHQN